MSLTAGQSGLTALLQTASSDLYGAAARKLLLLLHGSAASGPLHPPHCPSTHRRIDVWAAINEDLPQLAVLSTAATCVRGAGGSCSAMAVGGLIGMSALGRSPGGCSSRPLPASTARQLH